VAVVETAAALAVFGMARSLVKVMSDEARAGDVPYRAVAHGIALALATLTVVSVAVAGGATVVGRLFHDPAIGSAVRLLSLAIPPMVASDVLLAMVRFTRDMRPQVLARSVLEPLTLTGLALGAYLAGFREHGLLLAYVAALSVAAAVSLLALCRVYRMSKWLRVPLSWSTMRGLISFSAPTAVADLAAMLTTRVDVFLVSYFFPTQVVGVYGMAAQLSTIVKKIRQGFEPIVAPVVAQGLVGTGRQRVVGQIAMVGRWVLSVQIPVVLAFVVFGGALLGVIGAEFVSGWSILVVLIGGDALHGWLAFGEFPVLYLHPRVNGVLGALTPVLLVGFGVVLAGWLGPVGIAAAVLLAVLLVDLLRTEGTRRLLGAVPISPAAWKSLVAGLAATAAVLAVRQVAGGTGLLAAGLGLPVLLATYGAALWGLGLEPDDRRQLARVVQRFWPRPASP